jgi:hypothetical protein
MIHIQKKSAVEGRNIFYDSIKGRVGGQLSEIKVREPAGLRQHPSPVPSFTKEQK